MASADAPTRLTTWEALRALQEVPTVMQAAHRLAAASPPTSSSSSAVAASLRRAEAAVQAALEAVANEWRDEVNQEATRLSAAAEACEEDVRRLRAAARMASASLGIPVDSDADAATAWLHAPTAYDNDNRMCTDAPRPLMPPGSFATPAGLAAGVASPPPRSATATDAASTMQDSIDVTATAS